MERGKNLFNILQGQGKTEKRGLRQNLGIKDKQRHFNNKGVEKIHEKFIFFSELCYMGERKELRHITIE